jgi:peptidoglycan hydrolase CwlO-like protein
MSTKFKTTGILLSFIICIYLLRNNEASPGSFLKNNIGRFLQNQKLTERFCSDVPLTDPYTESQIEKAEGNRNSLAKIRNDEKTLTALIDNNEPDDGFLGTYLKSMIPILVPWAAFFVVSVLMFTVFLINFCCMNCRCCRNCACRCCLPPKTGRFKNCFATFSLICLVLAAGASAAGIYFSVNVPEEANATVCWAVRLLEKINEGSEEENWVGLSSGLDKVDLIVANVNGAVNDMAGFGVIVNSATNKINQASTLADSMYKDNQNISIDRIDPEEDSYVPGYIQNLGPSTNSKTTTGAIQFELNIKKKSLTSIDGIVKDLTSSVQRNADNIVNEIQGSNPTIMQVSDDISQIENNIAENQDTIKTIINAVGGVLLGLFIANATLAVIAFVAIVLVCCGARAFNKAVQISWCTIGLLMIVGWIVSTAVFGATILTFETCDVGTKSIEDPVFFNKTFDKVATLFDINDADFERTRGVLYTCVHGDGDLAREFELRQNMDIIQEIYTTIDSNHAQVMQSLSLMATSMVIPTTQTLLTKISEGTTPDSQLTLDDLVKLNSYTRSAANSCTDVDDTWVFNSKTCDGTAGTNFTSSSSDTFNLNNPTCIGYNAWSAGSDNIASRYTSSAFPQPGCANVNGQAMHLYLQSYIQNIGNNREQTQTVISRILEDLNNVDKANNQFTSELERIPNSIQDLNNTMASIDNMVTGPQGIITSMNCKFVRNDFETLLDVTCTGIGNTLYKITLTYLILAFITFVGTFMLFCLSKRFTLPSREEKQIENYKQVEIKANPVNQGSQFQSQSQYPILRK